MQDLQGQPITVRPVQPEGVKKRGNVMYVLASGRTFIGPKMPDDAIVTTTLTPTNNEYVKVQKVRKVDPVTFVETVEEIKTIEKSFNTEFSGYTSVSETTATEIKAARRKAALAVIEAQEFDLEAAERMLGITPA